MAGMRIGGLASGMDIDQIIGDLMKAERIPLDKLFQKKTTFEWQREAFRSINTKISNFDRYVFDNFSLSSNFNKTTVTSTNEAATATSSSNGSIMINSIDQLASAAYGVGDIADGTLSTTTMATLGKGDTAVTLSVLQNDGTMKDVSISFLATDKITDVVNKINGSNGGLTAFYDEASGQFSLSTKASGNNAAGGEIIDKNNSGFMGAFGFGTPDLATNGLNAKLTVNGAIIERSSNSFTVAGFNISLKAKSVTPITISATTDVESMVTKVKEFVEKYNEMIGGMNDLLKEKKYRNFPPLTDEQRKDMSEKEQELWDEKAKSGILKNDSILRSGLGDLRNSLYSRVTGIGVNVVDTLAEMGITTSSNYSDGGKLVIDEDKLRVAIIANPENVAKTFSQSDPDTTDAVDTRGIAQRMRDSMKNFIDKIEEKAGKASHTDQQYNIGKSLLTTNESIRNFENRLKDVEARYWRQFTAMEKAISQGNQQSAMLMGQMGGQ